MRETPPTGTLRAYLRVLNERRWLVASIIVLATAIGVAYCVLKTPEYEATAKIEFKNDSEDFPAIGLQSVPSFQPEKPIAADTEVVTRRDVVDEVKNNLGTKLSVSELRSSVDAVVQPDSNLVGVTATSTSAQEAADVANAFAQSAARARTQDRRRDYESSAKKLNAYIKSNSDLTPAQKGQFGSALARLTTLSAISRPVEVSRTAAVPSSPSNPKPALYIPLAAILGVLLGVGAAFLSNTLAIDRRIKTAEDLEEAMEMPILGQVPESLLLALHGNALQDPTSAEAEAFRTIRANLRYFNAGHRDVRTVLVTSISPEDGKSTVALSLASAAAGAGARTLLIEADLRNPSLARRVGFNANGGLSSILVGDGALYENRQPLPLVHRAGDGHVPGIGVDVVLAGLIPPNPGGLIESPRMDHLLAEAERDYDLVVIDTPPIPLVSDAIPLIERVQGVIVVGRLGNTSRNQAAALADQLRRLDAPILGVIANFGPPPDPEYYQYLYGHELSRT
jgi:capsular exopolysaccharide synthesis family protein